jgi:CubicO group peptidase (beta-lactamase class C family)
MHPRWLTATVTVVVAALAAGIGCAAAAGDGAVAPIALVRYHDPSAGWTAQVPATWPSAGIGPQFIRGKSLDDPTVLGLLTFRDREPGAALREFTALSGSTSPTAAGTRATKTLQWRRYRSHARADAAVAVELAVAKHGADAYVVALVARRAEVAPLLRSVLLPALDSFVVGTPDRTTSVLAETPADPSYWPTSGWRKATPASQGMDGSRLAALLTTIRKAKLPIDSVAVVRHGYLVLDAVFGPFAAGQLGEPYASGRLHELHSATKSVTSALVGIALRDAAATGARTTTPLLRFFAPYQPARTDARKRAITLRDVLTMQAGLEWTEWGAAYAPGSGNDLIAMIETAPSWTHYVLDRPMAAQPGTTFLYNSGASHVLSAVVSILSGRPAADFAAQRLFRPLGIDDYVWPSSPEGVTDGWGNLRLRPRDVAKLAFLYLHHGRWNGRTILPAGWVTSSTTDRIADPAYEYGYQWWLDRADGYAFMSGRFGQTAIVAPRADLVVVITAHLPETMSGTTPRLLFERYILPAAR